MGEYNDINKQISIEEKLREIEKSYFGLFNSVTEAIYVHKEDGIFLDVNEGAINMYGYPREELIGRTPQLVSAPGKNDIALILQLMQKVVSTGKPEQFEFWGQRKNGEIFLKDVIMNKGKYFGEEVIISTARDITERKAAENLLQKHTVRLERINDCLSSLSPDHLLNINRLTALCGELLYATCSLYNRLKDGYLCSYGQWNTPAGYNAIDEPEGHICFDVISGDHDEPILITDLQNTSYSETDPNVRAYGLQTYFGQAVRCAGEALGSLCVVYQTDYCPTDEDKRILGIIASSIGNEDTHYTAEFELQNSESQYRSLFNDSAVAIFEEDFSKVKAFFDSLKSACISDWKTYFNDHNDDLILCASLIKITDVNNECLNLFKINDKSEILKINYSRFGHGGWQVFKNEIIALAEGNQYFESAMQILDFENNHKQVILKLKVSPESQETLKRVIVSMIDITELKKTKETLIESEHKYKDLQNLFRIIADNMHDMIWAKDLENKYLFANKTLCDNLLMAKDTTEPFGKNDLFFVARERAKHADNPNWHTFGENCMDSDSIVLNSGKTQLFDEYGLVKNQFLFLEVIKAPLYNEQNKIIGTVGAARDVTDRKRAEQIQKILYSISNAVAITNDVVELIGFIREQLATLLDTTNFFVALYDESSDMLSSPFACDELDEIGSWPAEKSTTGYIIKKQKSLLATSEEIKKLCDNGEIEMLGTPAKVWLGVPLFMDGKVTGALVVQSYNNPYAYTQKDVEMLEFVSHQISLSIQRKKAEEEIRILNQDLENRVNERTFELQAINKQLEAFAYTISHDLRAPLRAIDGFTQILFEDYENLLDEKGKSTCSIIRQNTRKMNQLIDDLLDFSRLTSTEMTMKIINLNELVEKSFQELTTPETRKKINFIAGELPEVKGDQTMLQQVWTNLLSNALKFSSRQEKPIITISYLRTNDEYEFSIKDNGAGFDMNYANKLFGVFQRLHSLKEFEGTGVGLAIVQHIIQRHGGRIWAEGKEKQGATFYFSLPVLKSFKNNKQ